MNLDKPARPLAVTLTLWGVFLVGGWHAARALALLAQQPAAAALAVHPAPGSRLALAVAWAVLFGGCGVALWRKRPFTRRLIPILSALQALVDVGLLILFGQSPLNQARWLWTASLFLGWVLFCTWALNRPAAAPYFDM
ncbi:MAG: hypothetical protein KC425_16075 [Anaerolineales bacterium]|nr:hypothetical protein [Anaerolineales bacterium]